MAIYSESATNYYNFLRAKQLTITQGDNSNVQMMTPASGSPANGTPPTLPTQTPNSAGC